MSSMAKVTSNIAEDAYNAFSFQIASVAGSRPLWQLNLSVDKISFFIGATGSVAIGYFLNQYEPPNIYNVDYINQSAEESGKWSVFTDLLEHTVSHPLSIVERFFMGGVVYILLGYATHRMLKRGRPFACGALTGFYFAYGSPFTSMLKATFGFAAFSVVTESMLYLSRNR